MSLQLLSTIDSFAGAELHAVALRHAGLPDSFGSIGVENAARLAVMANLVGTLAPCVSGPAKKRVVATLPKWRLKRVLMFIEANIGERITLANLAAAAGLSRMYFAKQFRATTGMRPHDFILGRRIARAQQMLAESSDALVDIALSVGFRTQAHFTTVFKKISGSTPYQFRREQPKVA
jgi:AraC-like DNA-binding protein